MTENEVIEFLYDLLSITDYKMKHKEAVECAESVIEEIQQYRAIGTVEEFKALKEKNEQPTACNDGWISVKDRLPEDYGYYLVVYHEWSDGNYLPKYDDVMIKVMHYQVKDLATGYSGWNYPRTIGENADLIEADQRREVTHWQPLPNLPYQPKGE